MKAEERALPAGVRPLVPGDPPVIGRYALLGRLGAGGMGIVYLARDPGEAELVAVKTLKAAHADDREARQRFRTEAEYARRVSSWCTARVIEDGSDLSRPFLATEFIQGPPLSRVVERRGPLRSGSLHAVAIGVADALLTIHEAGVAHRDLKPSNVLLARSGPRIIDFGIAYALDAAGGPTEAGVVMGSPGWIAPERLTGAPATAASDVFGWGLLVAYAATGRNPFGIGDAAELAERIVTRPPDLSALKEPLYGLVMTALAKDPADRPEAGDLLTALLAPRGQDTAALAVADLWKPPPPDQTPEAGVALEFASSEKASSEKMAAGGARLVRRIGARPLVAAVGAFAAAALGAGILLAIQPGAGAQEPGRVEVTVTRTVPGSVPGGPGQAGAGQPGAGQPGAGAPVAGPTGGQPGAPTDDPTRAEPVKPATPPSGSSTPPPSTPPSAAPPVDPPPSATTKTKRPKKRKGSGGGKGGGGNEGQQGHGPRND